MRVVYSKKFAKQYKKLPKKLQRQTKVRISLWQENQKNSLLRQRRLAGELAHLYSINITGDIRVLYEVIGNEIYIFQLIGSHSQLY